MSHLGENTKKNRGTGGGYTVPKLLGVPMSSRSVVKGRFRSFLRPCSDGRSTPETNSHSFGRSLQGFAPNNRTIPVHPRTYVGTWSKIDFSYIIRLDRIWLVLNGDSGFPLLTGGLVLSVHGSLPSLIPTLRPFMVVTTRWLGVSSLYLKRDGPSHPLH